MKKVFLSLLLVACCQYSSAITVKTMLRTEAGISAIVGSLLAVSAITWASHTKTALSIDVDTGNKSDKAIHTFLVSGATFASIMSGIASYHAFKYAYKLLK